MQLASACLLVPILLTMAEHALRAQSPADTAAVLAIVRAQLAPHRHDSGTVGHEPAIVAATHLTSLLPVARRELGGLCLDGAPTDPLVTLAHIQIDEFAIRSDSAWVEYSTLSRGLGPGAA